MFQLMDKKIMQVYTQHIFLLGLMGKYPADGLVLRMVKICLASIMIEAKHMKSVLAIIVRAARVCVFCKPGFWSLLCQ